MDNQTIFTKTAKGLGEAVGKTKVLTRELRNILKEIDGKTPLEELLNNLGNVSEAKLHDALSQLSAGDFIREFVPLSTGDTVFGLTFEGKLEDAQSQFNMGDFLRELSPLTVASNNLDFKSSGQLAPEAQLAAENKFRADEMLLLEQMASAALEDEKKVQALEYGARRQTETIARQEAQAVREALAMQDAKEKIRRESEAQGQVKAQAAEKEVRRKAEVRARQQAEEKARREAETQARQDADEKVRRAAEAHAAAANSEQRRQAEELSRDQAEEETRRAGEAQARQELEERDRVEAEARAQAMGAEKEARRKAEVLARRQAEQKGRREAEAQARKEAMEKARCEAALKAELQAQAQAIEQEARRQAALFARQEAEEQVRRESEAQIRQAAEEKVRREAEAQAQAEAMEHQAREQAAQQARREAEVDARRAAEAQAKKDAEALAFHEAEEKSMRAALAQIKKDEEEKSRREAELQAELQAAAQARREAEDNARRDTELQARKAREDQFRLEAKELAQQAAAAQQADEQARSQAEEPARPEVDEDGVELEDEVEAAAVAAYPAATASQGSQKLYKGPGNWSKPLTFGLFFLIVLGLGLMHILPFESQVMLFEKAATEQFQQPVKINQVHLSLLPQPHWRLDGVSIGRASQIRINQVNAMAELGTLLSDRRVIKSVELHSPVFNEEGLSWLLFGHFQSGIFKLDQIRASNARLDTPGISLSAFDARADLGENASWKKIILDSAESKIRIELQPKDAAIQIEITADTLVLPFGSTFTLDKFNAKGRVDRNELILSEFSGSSYAGILTGNARLKWGARWTLSGEVNAKQIDAASLVPQLLPSGKLEGNATYVFQAKDANKLFAAARLRGNFTVQNGTLLGVDFASLLRSPASGGKSLFNEITGGFSYENGSMQLHKVHLGAGLVSAHGSADMDANDNLNGQFVVDLKSPIRQARAHLALSGTLKEPHFNK